MNKNRSYICLLIPVIAFSIAGLRADEIILSNGDKVSGKIINTVAEKITVSTEFMGEISIDRKGIVSIRTDEPLNLTVAEGEKVVGTVATEGDGLKVTKTDETEMALSLESLKAIRDDASQAKWEREQERLNNPRLLDFWAGSVDLGLAASQGNSDTTTISSGAEIVRRTGFDKITLTYSQLYATQSTTEPFGKTANLIQGAGKYDRNISKKVFAFGTGSLEFDEFQNLDLRSVLGGGLGWHILDADAHTLDFGAGGSWNREKFNTGLTRNSGEVNLYEESSHGLNSRIKLYQSMGLYPNLSERGEFRYRLDAGLDVAINSSFSLKVGVGERYLSNPLPGNNKNDLIFTTGLKYTFSQN